MDKMMRSLQKASRKIAKWYPGQVTYRARIDGFTCVIGAGPTIGFVDNDLWGAQDDFDEFLDLLGFEGQAERVLFDPTRAKFVLDAGWSGKFWRKPTDTEEVCVTTIADRFPYKISVSVVMLILATQSETRRRVWEKIKKPLDF
jgi:hypothetical protein